VTSGPTNRNTRWPFISKENSRPHSRRKSRPSPVPGSPRNPGEHRRCWRRCDRSPCPNQRTAGPEVSQLKESNGRARWSWVRRHGHAERQGLREGPEHDGNRVFNREWQPELCPKPGGTTGRDDELISARSRASMSRPFTRVKPWKPGPANNGSKKSRAGARQRQMEQSIQELQTRNAAGASGRTSFCRLNNRRNLTSTRKRASS